MTWFCCGWVVLSIPAAVIVYFALVMGSIQEDDAEASDRLEGVPG
jgi:hypothetical protein